MDNTHDEVIPPILTKEGYFTRPSIDVLDKMSEEELSNVNDFMVGCQGIGEIVFPGKTNVNGLDINRIVVFNKREVILYPNDNEKPPIGKGLNKKAIITLYKCWPFTKNEGKKKALKDDEKALNRFEQKLKMKTEGSKGIFLGYDKENGAWKFQVDSFS